MAGGEGAVHFCAPVTLRWRNEMGMGLREVAWARNLKTEPVGGERGADGRACLRTCGWWRVGYATTGRRTRLDAAARWRAAERVDGCGDGGGGWRGFRRF